jgi:hypothetical protein
MVEKRRIRQLIICLPLAVAGRLLTTEGPLKVASVTETPSAACDDVTFRQEAPEAIASGCKHFKSATRSSWGVPIADARWTSTPGAGPTARFSFR